MKLLFVTSTRIGDAVLSTGLLDHLSKTWPDAKITVAAGYLPAPLFEAFPSVERVIPIRKRRYALHWVGLWGATMGSFWDLVIDLRGSALGWMLPAKRRKIIGKPRAGEHRVETLGRLFDLSPALSPVLFTTEPNRNKAAGMMGTGPMIGLGVTANWLPKIWPADRFVALADAMTGGGGPFPGARLAVFGGPGEEEIARPVLDALGERAVTLVGTSPIVETAACLERCSFFVGNDSGLMHMAAALGVPTVGLFGPSPPGHYGPWGANCRAVSGDISYEELVSDPGFDHRKTENLMAGLSVEKVFESVTGLIADMSKAGGAS